MVFFIGLAEAVSYWKCACPPNFRVECGELSAKDIEFFKKLWFNGLGEFFYRNGIKTDMASFVNIELRSLGKSRNAKAMLRPG